MILEIKNLVKRYGEFLALDNLNLTVEKGEIFGFVGPNGAGKTTAMKITAGLLQATSGSVTVDGISVADNPGKVRERIGYMPDFFGVYDNLKVFEYMDFYGGCYGISPAERMKRADELLELVDLTDKWDSYVDTLSRGMKQRLCLARSLIHNPALLILDEPASGLDPRARIEMKGILKTLKSMGKTILISSHILPELAELCTSIGVMERGRMVYYGRMDALLERLTGRNMVRIRVLQDADKAIRLLKEQPVVVDVSGQDNTLEVVCSGGDEELRQLLKVLVERDIPVVSFANVEGNLENVFMEVTRGEV